MGYHRSPSSERPSSKQFKVSNNHAVSRPFHRNPQHEKGGVVEGTISIHSEPVTKGLISQKTRNICLPRLINGPPSESQAPHPHEREDKKKYIYVHP